MSGFRNLKDTDRFTVYKHTNKINGKSYVGITKTTVEARKLYGYGGSVKFNNALNKYGWDNFETIILEQGLTLQEACDKEQFYIEKFKCIAQGYNIQKGGMYSTMSDEGKQRVAEANRRNKQALGYHHTEEHKEHYGKVMRKYWSNPANREAISEKLKGAKRTEEQRQHYRDFWNSEKGLEAKERMSKAYTGKHLSIEAKQKIKDRWKDPELLARRSKKYTGRIHITNGKENKFLQPEDAQVYLNNGWRRGKTQFTKLTEEGRKNYSKARTGTVAINNGIQNKYTRPEQLQDYLNNGWILGWKKRPKS